jgi:predicted double-glycine peptidase
MVVIDLDSDQVTVLDPWHGERRVLRDDFQEAWSALRFLTIVVAA